jgi:ATP synthase protein I
VTARRWIGKPLVYSRGFARWRVIEPGRGAAYAVLFSEIGISLLITTLVGVLVGRWIDAQLGSLPVFVIVGFLVGAGSGTLMIYRLVSRFLKTIE